MPIKVYWNKKNGHKIPYNNKTLDGGQSFIAEGFLA